MSLEGWFGSGDPYELLHIARQKPPPPPLPAMMKVNVASYPPLSQVTVVKDGGINFTAVLEVPLALAEEPWEVSLWLSKDGAEWVDAPLSPMPKDGPSVSVQDQPEMLVRLYFKGDLSVFRKCSFTIKFRPNPDETWRWIRDEADMGDGSAIVSPEPALPASSVDLSELIKDLNPAWHVTPRTSQSPGTRLWSLEKTIAAANGEDSCHEDVVIGVPWGAFMRWVSITRLWDPWLAPAHGKTKFDLDRDGTLCSFLSEEGQTMVLLGISGMNDVEAIFRGDDGGNVIAKARNDGGAPEKAVVLVATGEDFQKATAAVMYHARDLVMAAKRASGELADEVGALRFGEEGDITPQWRENWYDGLGYCTWNGLGQRLTDQKIYDALDKLAASNIQITNLIIDDNWQNIDYHGEGQFQYAWVDFEAEPKAFPKGLKATVQHIRAMHPDIKHIAVWHALLGYWGGISPGGNLAKKYKTIEVCRREEKRRQLPLGGPMTVVAQEDVQKFYTDFYSFLASAGISGVKTDAQFMSDLWISAPVRRTLINTYLDAWAISSMRYFSSRAISCMSQTPNILFHSQLPRNRPPLLVRNSDDFFPDVPASHPWHVFVNAYNCLFTSFLNVLPDWDMFQTVHDYSAFHAAARCVSGGPVYITDAPGEHDMALIGQMTARTTRGATVVLRNSVLGRAAEPYVGYHDNVLLKVGSYNGSAMSGTPILGIFNISAQPLTELVSLASFPGVVDSLPYIVRAHTTRKVTPPVGSSSPEGLLTLTLDVRGYEILSAFPVHTLEKDGASARLANLGFLNKMSGAAAIVSSSFEMTENGRVLFVTSLKALGILGIYLSHLPSLTIDNDFMATIQGQPIPPHTVSISKDDAHVLEIDVETAWVEMGLKSGWSNEVQIKVYFSLQ